MAENRGGTATRMRFVAPASMGGKVDVSNRIGRYEIAETLGKGAMGVVYKARDPLLDRTVAVKTIIPPRTGGKRAKEAYLERFKREAMAAAKMQHSAIVTIFDVGVDEKSGSPFMVLEYLPGESLADRLDHFRLRLGRAVQIGQDLAAALAFAHRKRIVHRDVKPANVLFAGDNHWKLADFGIARLPDSELTQVGIFMGTPGYAPPESIRDGLYTPQSDVFAWGAVLYEMICGRIPYEGPDTKTTNKLVTQAAAKPPSRWDSSIPQPIVDVTMRALHPDPNERYRDAEIAGAALSEAWETCIANNLVGAASFSGKDVSHNHVKGPLHGGGNPAPAKSAPAPAPEWQTVVDSAPPIPQAPPMPHATPAQVPAPQAIAQPPSPQQPMHMAGMAVAPSMQSPQPLGHSPVFRRPTSQLGSNTGLWVALGVLGAVVVALLIVLVAL